MTRQLRRDLGTIESYAALLGILIGAGIFKVTSDAWALTGPSVILGYFVLAPAVLATSVAYAVFLSTPLGREPGGEYTHLSRTFGGFGVAFVGAWLKVISYIGALAYLARAFADYVYPSPWVAVAVLLCFYAIHVAGVRWFGRIQVTMCALLGVSLVVLVVPGLFAIRPENYRPFFTHGLRGFGASLPPLFFAYAGFESLAQTAGEVRDSTTRLPRVFLRGITATMIIYLLMSMVALGVLDARQLAASPAPMTAAASRYLPFAAAWIVTLGAIMAITTSLNATMLVPSRIAVMLSEDGLAPRWMGAIDPRTGTPVIGLTLTLAGALVLLLSGKVSLALNIAVFALVVLYFLHSIALLMLPRLNPMLYSQVTTRIPRWLQIASAIVSILAMGFIIAVQAIDSFATIQLALVWAAVGAVMFLVMRRSTP
jgi:amino acid transporter